MRVRSDKKRQEIVCVAARLFEDIGYERTSMALISQEVGGSKATLYGYFSSKEELLRAVLAYDVGQSLDQIMQVFHSQKELRAGLICLGVAYLERHLASPTIANIRTVATQPTDSELGRRFYLDVLRPAWERLRDEFAALIKAGKLRAADPWTMAMHWKGLNEGDLFDRKLLGALDTLSKKELEQNAAQAADAFLSIYGIKPQPEV
jgi:AcrR family transcriptional regulator